MEFLAGNIDKDIRPIRVFTVNFLTALDIDIKHTNLQSIYEKSSAFMYVRVGLVLIILIYFAVVDERKHLFCQSAIVFPMHVAMLNEQILSNILFR